MPSSIPHPLPPTLSAANARDMSQESDIIFCDWDAEELSAVQRCGLKYAIRSSKYPRVLRSPHRTLIIHPSGNTYSIHTLLLKTFSTHISSLLKTTPQNEPLYLSLPQALASLPAWTLYTTWLYSFDKIPLPDYTPLRPPSTTTETLTTASLLAAHLGANKFEKWLLRIIFRELHYNTYPISHLLYLRDNIKKGCGMWYFSRAWTRWRDSGWVGELDPYRWRVEHWYAICGTLGNWGCFHAMNTSGWGGVWGRQEGLKEEVRGRDLQVVLGWRDWDGSDDDSDSDGCEGSGSSGGESVVRDGGVRVVERGRTVDRGRAVERPRVMDQNRGFERPRTIQAPKPKRRPCLAHRFENGGLGKPPIGPHALLPSRRTHGLDGASDTASGEELWEEWWEDEDLYSRLPDPADFADLENGDLEVGGLDGGDGE